MYVAEFETACSSERVRKGKSGERKSRGNSKSSNEVVLAAENSHHSSRGPALLLELTVISRECVRVRRGRISSETKQCLAKNRKLLAEISFAIHPLDSQSLSDVCFWYPPIWQRKKQ